MTSIEDEAAEVRATTWRAVRIALVAVIAILGATVATVALIHDHAVSTQQDQDRADFEARTDQINRQQQADQRCIEHYVNSNARRALILQGPANARIDDLFRAFREALVKGNPKLARHLARKALREDARYRRLLRKHPVVRPELRCRRTLPPPGPPSKPSQPSPHPSATRTMTAPGPTATVTVHAAPRTRTVTVTVPPGKGSAVTRTATVTVTAPNPLCTAVPGITAC